MGLELSPARIDSHEPAVDKPERRGTLLESGELTLELSRQPLIIVVQERDEFSRGLAQTQFSCLCYGQRRFYHAADPRVIEGCQVGRGRRRRGIVQDDQLEDAEGLAEA